MLDESLLDDPEALTLADRPGLLRAAAESGALLRTALRDTAEAGLLDLKPEGRPRAILVATAGGTAASCADVLATLAGPACPVVRLAPTGVAADPGALRWTLPGWAGPVDLLLIATPHGSEPGLGLLAEQAYRRGCTVVAVTPRRTPLTEVVDGSRGLAVPLATTSRNRPPYGDGNPGDDAAAEPDRAREQERDQEPAATDSLWPTLVPFLSLLDRTGLYAATEETLLAVADRLDATAERCGPAVPTGSNPAKSLALELDECLPLLWTEGTTAAPAARRFAALLAGRAGRPALAAELPEALDDHSALLSRARSQEGGPADLDDFFRDRVEEPATLQPRVVLLRTRPADGLTATPAARELARAHHTPVTDLQPPEGGELECLGELLALTEFTTAYLATRAQPE
ncbi:SIS domain-containing protein [Streptomyces sp. NPDC049954]|uniref:SIS domain-containing protein n=1 Tax=Streptomyces sp. NPDC049954 TaxID=3155779 RepID=UPI00344A93D2